MTSGAMLVATRKHPAALWVTYTTLPSSRRRVAMSSASVADALATDAGDRFR